MAFDTRLLTGLNVLAAVLDAGNFVRAGQVLGLTQSGVSRSIQRLEQRLGVRLFERTSKSMRLTDDGKRFCEEVLPLLSRLEEAAEETVRSAGSVRGRLRINVDPTFAPHGPGTPDWVVSQKVSRPASRLGRARS